MFLCTCNKCGNVWEDTNPDSPKSINYPETPANMAHSALIDHSCPVCKTDDNLVDNVSDWVTPDINDPEQEIIKFTLENDPETYYTISQDYMQDHASDEGKEVENWGIAVDGLPPAAVAIATNIYIDYGIRAAQ